MEKISENWSKIYQCANKPIIELAELNIQSLNKFIEQAKTAQDTLKNPESLGANPAETATKFYALATDYTRQASEIMIKGWTEIGKICSESLQQAGSQVMSSAKSGLNEATNNRHK